MSIFNVPTIAPIPPAAQVAADYIDANNQAGSLALYWSALESFNQLWNRADASPVEIANYWGQSAFLARVGQYIAVSEFIAQLNIPAALLSPGQLSLPGVTVAGGFLVLPPAPSQWTINEDGTISPSGN